MLTDHLEEIVNFFRKYHEDEKVRKYILEALDDVVREPTWDKHNALGFMFGVYYCLNKLIGIEQDAKLEKPDNVIDQFSDLDYEDFMAAVKRLMRENLDE